MSISDLEEAIRNMEQCARFYAGLAEELEDLVSAIGKYIEEPVKIMEREYSHVLTGTEDRSKGKIVEKFEDKAEKYLALTRNLKNSLQGVKSTLSNKRQLAGRQVAFYNAQKAKFKRDLEIAREEERRKREEERRKQEAERNEAMMKLGLRKF